MTALRSLTETCRTSPLNLLIAVAEVDGDGFGRHVAGDAVGKLLEWRLLPPVEDKELDHPGDDELGLVVG